MSTFDYCFIIQCAIVSAQYGIKGPADTRMLVRVNCTVCTGVRLVDTPHNKPPRPVAASPDDIMISASGTPPPELDNSPATECTSHTHTVPSAAPLPKHRLSGEKSNEYTILLWPWMSRFWPESVDAVALGGGVWRPVNR